MLRALVSAKSVPDEVSVTLNDQDFLFVDRGFEVVVETQDFPVQLCVEEGVLAIKPVLRANAALHSKDGGMNVVTCARVGLADDANLLPVVFLLETVGGFEGGALACFGKHVFVVVVLFEI